MCSLLKKLYTKQEGTNDDCYKHENSTEPNVETNCCNDEMNNELEEGDNSEDSHTDYVSQAFGILAYTAASLDGEISEEEIQTIVTVAETTGLNTTVVAQSILMEKLGVRPYNHWSEIADSTPTEYYSDLFHGIIMTLISDSELKKVELQFLMQLAEVLEIDVESVQEAIAFHVINFNRSFHDRKVDIETNEPTQNIKVEETHHDIDQLWSAVINNLPVDIKANVSSPSGRAYFFIKSNNGPQGVKDFKYVVNYHIRAAMCAVSVETLNGGESGKSLIEKYIGKASGDSFIKGIEPQQGAKNKNKWSWAKSESFAGKSHEMLVQWYIDTIVAFYRFFETV